MEKIEFIIAIAIPAPIIFLNKAEENLKAARKEIDEIRSSTTFRVGRIVTAIPRKIKCLLKGEKNA